ncbi:MAG: ATP-binding cassette domain-containing protein [Pseudonocardiaceae bacterium]
MAEPSIAMENVQVSVKDCRILDDVNLSSAAYEWTLLVGPSGCGKSTVLRTINGLCTPSRGRVFSLGTWLPGRNRHEARQAWRSTGTLLQELALFETRTVLTNVELGCRAAGMDAAQARVAALGWLDRLGLGSHAQRFPATLSGGQRQRVAVARALAPRPRLLLLDEPASALDDETAALVLDGIGELVADGSCVVMSSHRPEEVGSRCSRCVVLEGGRVVRVTSGLPDTVTTGPARGE